MHIGRRYTLKEFLYWTRRDIYLICFLAAVPCILFELAGIEWIAVPWVPVALIGTATAFISGFKNTQSYDRLWEARQIWGAIVNDSRSWGIMVKDFIRTGNDIHTQLIYRHCAWLTALRYQLREPRQWENQTQPNNIEFRRMFSVPEHEVPLEDELRPFLSETDLKYILSKKNRATQLITLQSAQLKELKILQKVDSYEYVELEKRLATLYDHQGKCERIKGFPYPRQYASINLFFVWLFVFLLPLGLLREFDKLGNHYIWLTVPFSIAVGWVFVTMERVGEVTENPFEGGPNDIPMASLSRTIEIDLREMLEETDLPPTKEAENNILL